MLYAGNYICLPVIAATYFDEAFVYVVTWFSLREAWSVLENLSEMGLQFPQDIVKKVAGQIKKEDENNK